MDGGGSIDFLMRADVDEEQNFRAGFRMFLFSKNNPAIVTGGTCVQSGQPPAQVMRFQAGVMRILRQSAYRRLDFGCSAGFFLTRR
jgi:hypothetical protein